MLTRGKKNWTLTDILITPKNKTFEDALIGKHFGGGGKTKILEDASWGLLTCLDLQYTLIKYLDLKYI
jgi:hypothetical protein